MTWSGPFMVRRKIEGRWAEAKAQGLRLPPPPQDAWSRYFAAGAFDRLQTYAATRWMRAGPSTSLNAGIASVPSETFMLRPLVTVSAIVASLLP